MLDLQVVDLIANKENLPFALDPQNKRSTPHLNQVLSKTRRNMWTNEMLKAAMDDVERGTHSLRKANKLWNIPMSSLTNH
jgi:hypothetical protein